MPSKREILIFLNERKIIGEKFKSQFRTLNNNLSLVLILKLCRQHL